MSARGLGKRYRIRQSRSTPAGIFRATLGTVLAPLDHLCRMLLPPQPDEIHWALRDISFELRGGEIVGFIGRNGAGKTTLFKLLARLTAPTEGRAVIRGRVASVLAMGAKPQRDLTGRENALIIGQLLGMTRAEVRDRIEAIIEFAELQRFADTPAKYYSTGMYLRLVMSIIAHVPAEVLIVDEVLAAADSSFQRRAVSKLLEFATTENRTVLFVSHNINTVLSLCTRAILLEEGRLVVDGPPSEVVREYLSRGGEAEGERRWMAESAPRFSDVDSTAAEHDEDDLRIHRVRTVAPDGETTALFDVRHPLAIEVEYEVLAERFSYTLQLYLHNERGQLVAVAMDNAASPWRDRPHPVGLFTSRCTFPGDLFNSCSLRIELRVTTRPDRYELRLDDIANIRVEDAGEPDGVRGDWVGDWPAAVVRPRCTWENSALSEREP